MVEAPNYASLPDRDMEKTSYISTVRLAALFCLPDLEHTFSPMSPKHGKIRREQSLPGSYVYH